MILTLPLLMGTALLINAAFPARGRLANGLALACLIYGQIVLLAEVLSELHALNSAGYLAGHGLLFALSVLLWWRRGRPSLWRHRGWPLSEIVAGIRHNRLLAIFAAAVLLVSLANLVLAVVYPVQEPDALNYHLPRAYVWSQQQTAHHYPTDDFRQVEFPPSASFVSLWMIVNAPDATRWMHVPQWIAGIVLALGTAALARLAGHRRGAAIFAGLVTLTGTNTVLQMTLPSNDLLTGAAGVSFIYFAFKFFANVADGVPFRQNHELSYAGLAFGLALGTKLTVFFLLPGAGLALLIYAFWCLRWRALQPVLWLGISTLIGLGLFGSYNYVLNLLDFGNPITAHSLDDASALEIDRPRPELYSPGDNLIRYLYMTMDWAMLGPTDANPLFRLNGQMFSTASDVLGLNPQAAQEFGFEGIGQRSLSFATSGFGPVIYLALLVSPLLAVVFLWQLRRSPRWLIPVLLLGIVWGWLIAFSWITPWSPYRTRYFSLFIPLLIAALLPWLYARTRWRGLWLLPVMALCLWTAAWTTLNGFRRASYLDQTLKGQFSYDLAAGYRRESFDLLRAALPPGKTLGLTGMNLLPWEVMAWVPEFRYEIVPEDRVADWLAAGGAAILSSMADCPGAGVPYLTLELTSHVKCVLMTASQARTLIEHPAAQTFFGYAWTGPPQDQTLTLDPARALLTLDDFGLHIDVPAPLFDAHDLYLDVTFASGGIPAENVHETPTCNDQPVDLVLRPEGLSLHLTPEQYDPNRVLQRCQMTFDYTPDRVIAQAQIYPYTLTPPDTQVSARFDTGMSLVGAVTDPDVPVCGTLHLTTWWQAATSPAGDLEVYLLDARGFALANSRAPLAGASDATRLVDRRGLDLPCDLVPGTYDLMFRLYPPGGDDPLPMAESGGLTLARLGAVTITQN